MEVSQTAVPYRTLDASPGSAGSGVSTQPQSRLSDVLFRCGLRGFDSLAPLPSNVGAVEASLQFAQGRAPFVALVGPSGWGKTHLLEAVSLRLSAETQRPLGPIGVQVWFDEGRRPASSSSRLLLDNVQEAFTKPRLSQALRMELERRARLGQPTMLAFTGDRPCRRMRALLPRWRDWSVETIGTPFAPERALVIRQIALAEGLNLGDALTHVLATRLQGNGRTLHGALTTLRLDAADWRSPKATLKALGLLAPFFEGSPWDMVLYLSHAVRDYADESEPLSELTAYVLLRLTGLAEVTVARELEVRPAELYARAMKYESMLQTDPARRTRLSKLIECIVRIL